MGKRIDNLHDILQIPSMIERTLEGALKAAAEKMPIVAVIGPRQSGKTTLCRAAFPEKRYVSLEPLDIRDFAREDPRGFLEEHREGAVIDEAQRAPGLFSYLQGEVDERPEAGRFILTGSQHFGLTESITQSLAGRVALLTLLPPSLEELQRFENAPTDLMSTLWMGSYPRIYDRELEPRSWLGDYVATYVQRDVRQVLNVSDLEAFTSFLRLAAGRTGSELHLSRMAGDTGVSHNTVRSWISVLETGFLLFRLSSWHRNLRKRVVKAPKVHFIDSGLACHLLGIHEPEQLRHHPLRGAIFESWVASEIFKIQAHRGRSPILFHLRDDKGLEIDIILEKADTVVGVECKAGATVAPGFFRGLETLRRLLESSHPSFGADLRLVYGGKESQRRGGIQVVPWSRVPSLEW
jgi:predicted AAA+ superfamily ATPase